MRQRRANKILMSIVLILLCLVLITTSVVSGIFAKYTVSKQILMMFGFESFGLQIEVFVDENIRDRLEAKDITGEGTAQITISNLLMHPGDVFSEALIFKVSGNPTVDAIVKIEASIVNTDNCFDNKFKIDNQAFPTLFSGSETEKPYVPMGFYVNKNYVVKPYSNKTASEITSAIKTESTNAVSGVEYKQGVLLESKKIVSFGFDWQKEWTAVPNSDEIGTWISNQEKAEFTVIYTVTVEQKTEPTN